MKTIKLLGCLVGVAFAAFLVFDSYAGVNRASSDTREGTEKVKAAQAELERVQRNQN